MQYKYILNKQYSIKYVYVSFLFLYTQRNIYRLVLSTIQFNAVRLFNSTRRFNSIRRDSAAQRPARVRSAQQAADSSNLTEPSN